MCFQTFSSLSKSFVVNSFSAMHVFIIIFQFQKVMLVARISRAQDINYFVCNANEEYPQPLQLYFSHWKRTKCSSSCAIQKSFSADIFQITQKHFIRHDFELSLLVYLPGRNWWLNIFFHHEKDFVNLHDGMAFFILHLSEWFNEIFVVNDSKKSLDKRRDFFSEMLSWQHV